MVSDLIKYAFIAGELSPTLLGRTDLEKYDLGLALARNFFVDYRGGLSTRAGTRFVDFVMHDDKPTKFIPFKFAPAVSSTYVLVFGHEYVRFVQDGAYVLEPEKTITAVTQADPGVVTSTAHGYQNGDWIKVFDAAGMTGLNERTFIVANKTTDTFELRDPFGVAFDTSGLAAYTGSGKAYRIYTVATPYDAADLELLRGHQARSTVRLTHPDYKVRTLTRISDTNWTLTEVEYGETIAPPTGLSIDPSATGTAGVGFCVTSVDIDGVESIASKYTFRDNIVNYVSEEAGSVLFEWNPVPGAVHYRVYRTNVVPKGVDTSRAMQVGFIGTAYGPQLADANIIPDFTRTPPQHYNPFADGAIRFIDVLTDGSGYTKTSTVSASGGGGTGFEGFPVVSDGGDLLAIVVTKGGEGYADPVTITVSGGTGATFDVTLSEADGNNPGVSTVFQQRQVYAATDNQPLTVWGSRPGEFDNFDGSQIIQEDDSYEFELDSEEVAPIRHLLPSRSGLVMFSQAGIWQLAGGSGVAVTATNALADPQSYTGASNLPPLPVDTDILYVEGRGATVRLLSYNDYSKVFAGQDLSILSNHLTVPEKPITSWAYASDPFKLVHAVRSDGMMLILTLVKEQNVFGWTQASTKGLFNDVLSIQEGLTDTVYTMVTRRINGRYTKMIEQFARRTFAHVEEAWCVDSGLSNTPNYPDATLNASASSGVGVVFTASAAVFSADDVGSVIRAGGCKATITAYTNSTTVVATIQRAYDAVLPETDGLVPLPALSGEWTLDAPISVVGGLWHLEGEMVQILADGNVLPAQPVIDGRVDLGVAATRIIVGLGFSAVAKTLPPTTPNGVIEGKKKRIVAIKARLHQSRGLSSGANLAKMYEMKERLNEDYGEPTRLQEGIKTTLIEAPYDENGQVYFEQTHPLPATILGFVLEVDVGDVGR